MTKLKLTIIILLFTKTLTSYGQTDSVNVLINVTNKNLNDSWYDEILTQKKGQQIESIKKRILNDAIYLTSDTTSSIQYRQGEMLKIDFHCRPLLKINGNDIHIDKADQARQISSILGDTDFNKIEILKPDRAKEKYGKWGLCGVILLTTKDKKINDLIKNLGL